MITNDRQYKITRAAARRLEQGLKAAEAQGPPPETEPVSDRFDLDVESGSGEQFDVSFGWAWMVDDRELSSVVECAFCVLGRGFGSGGLAHHGIVD